MTDRELLELAAKAAGVEIEWIDSYTAVLENGMEWNPRTDDGDSRRLATRLHLVVASMRGDHERPAFSTCYHFNGPECSSEPHGDDPDGATRLAVLRTAAAIGKALQSKSANSEAPGLARALRVFGELTG